LFFCRSMEFHYGHLPQAAAGERSPTICPCVKK
jgi:hypothetical protein